jgi:hypothetical protein
VISRVSVLVAALVCAVLAGCGATKMVKDPEGLVLEQPLASNADSHLDIKLDFVIVRGGPGTWARNAYWDEYLLRIENRTDQPITLIRVYIVDSQQFSQRSSGDRSYLLKASKETKKRYKKHGLTVKAGVNPGALVLASGAAFVGGAAVGIAALGGSATAVGAAGAAVAAIYAAPVLLLAGGIQAHNTGVVSDEIRKRHTKLPRELQPGEKQELDLFYPLAPSPLQVEIQYRLKDIYHTLTLDTSEVLEGLHIVKD